MPFIKQGKKKPKKLPASEDNLKRTTKSCGTYSFKTAKMSSHIEEDMEPWELVVVCTTYIVPTKRASKFFEGEVDEWKLHAFRLLNSQHFALVVRKYLPEGWNIDWNSGFAFSEEWSIRNVKTLTGKPSSAPYHIDVRFSVPRTVVEQARHKAKKLRDEINPLFEAIDNAFCDIINESEGMLSIYYRKK